MSNEPGHERNISVETPPGAIYRPIHVERRVTIYPIQEHELDSLADAQNNSTLWASIGSGAATLFAACLWDACMATGPLPPASWLFGAVCVLVSIGGFILSYRYRASVKERLGKIRTESTAFPG
jgi:hypothetical protein